MLGRGNTFKRRAEDANEYRELVKHADALNIVVKNVRFNGSWKTSDGHPVHITSTQNVHDVGYKYFVVDIDGQKEHIEPAEGSSVSDEGTVTIEFEPK